MRVYTSFAALLFLSFFWGCTNIEDATPSTRSSFIHLYEGPESYLSTDIIEVSDGFILLGNMFGADDSLYTVVIKTDKYGNTKIDSTYIGGTGKSIIPYSFSGTNFNGDGYLIIGDRIKIDATLEPAGNIVVDAVRILGINQNLEMIGSATIKDPRPIVQNGPVLIDFKGNSLTTTDDGRVVLLNSYRASGSERPLLYTLKKDFSLYDSSDPYQSIDSMDVDWFEYYDLVDKDYVNGKSVHSFGNKIVWASSIQKTTGSFWDTYVAVPTIEEPLSFVNYSLLGDNFPTQKQFNVSDIQPAINISFGFGIVGTFAETDGTKKNMFFTKVDATGTIQSSDTIFIDAVRGKTTSNLSDIDDTGESITSTSDGGYVLAGTVTTTTVGNKTVGNGERDIFLVKINAFGEIVWQKIIGGSGDEVVSRIRETEDQGLVITGTNNIGGYSSIFLIKTDKNGELKN